MYAKNTEVPVEKTRKRNDGWKGPEESVKRERVDQESRRRWRSLALMIKAKLECVETGITDFETEFMAQIVLPDGSTVGQFMKPQIAHAYTHGKMPLMLTAGVED